MTSGTDVTDEVLSEADLQAFYRDGFVKLAGAFPREMADTCRQRLWNETGVDPDDRATWTRPVVRIPPINDHPFPDSCNTPRLHAAYNQLYGRGRWTDPDWPGTFPVRFPHPDEPDDSDWHVDAGWHVDESWVDDLDDGDISKVDGYGFRVNIFSRGRGLLLLLLYSDVSADDAPTVIRVGSHHDVPPLLAPLGEAGTGAFESDDLDRLTAHRTEALATGAAGDAYLVHPFVVHRSQAHRGREPRFMAQTALDQLEELNFNRPDTEFSPVEVAVVDSLRAAGCALPVRG